MDGSVARDTTDAFQTNTSLPSSEKAKCCCTRNVASGVLMSEGARCKGQATEQILGDRVHMWVPPGSTAIFCGLFYDLSGCTVSSDRIFDCKGFGRKPLWSKSMYHPYICLEVLRSATKTGSQDRCADPFGLHPCRRRCHWLLPSVYEPDVTLRDRRVAYFSPWCR